jgi:5-(carboxyamino)imidazole ribonucleotide mutase
MPNGIPVATVALNAAKNAGILAARIIGAFDAEVQAKMDAYAVSMKEMVEESGKNLEL